jgi:flagellar basal-body rod modification protein FlgD
MTTMPVTTVSPVPTAASAQSSAAQQLTGNFNTFLTLLTTQLKNQDPTSPMDSSQFTQQLVSFSQVEQQINTNDNLKTLISQGQSANGAYAMSYLGHTVTVAGGQAALSGGKADWNYDLNTQSSATTLNVTNANGVVVYSAPGETAAGSHDFQWDGTDANGNQLPDGTYSLKVTAQASDGTGVQSSVTSKGVVSEVDMSGANPMLMIGPMSVPPSSVSAVAQQ